MHNCIQAMSQCKTPDTVHLLECSCKAEHNVCTGACSTHACASGMVRKCPKLGCMPSMLTCTCILQTSGPLGWCCWSWQEAKCPWRAAPSPRSSLDTVHGDAPSLQTCGCTHKYSKVSVPLLVFMMCSSISSSRCSAALHLLVPHSCTDARAYPGPTFPLRSTLLRRGWTAWWRLASTRTPTSAPRRLSCLRTRC